MGTGTRIVLFRLLAFFYGMQPIASAQANTEALCEFESENLQTHQTSSMVPFFMDLMPSDGAFSSKELVPIDDKTFVAKIYGTPAADKFTLSLEIQMGDGSLFPRAAASMYRDGRNYMLALIDGVNLLKFVCHSL